MAETQLIIEARDTATIQLVDLLSTHLYQGFQTMYQQAMKMNQHQSLQMFQKILERIPLLSDHVLKVDYDYLVQDREVSESVLTQLIKDIFITQARLVLLNHGVSDLSRKQLVSMLSKTQIIPSNITFIHQCYIVTARKIYCRPYLFSHKYSIEQRDRNQELILQLIKESIEQTIRQTLPIEYLLTQWKNLQSKNKAISIKQSPVKSPEPPIKVDTLGSSHLESDLTSLRSQTNNLEKYLDLKLDSHAGSLQPSDSPNKLTKNNLDRLNDWQDKIKLKIKSEWIKQDHLKETPSRKSKSEISKSYTRSKKKPLDIDSFKSEQSDSVELSMSGASIASQSTGQSSQATSTRQSGGSQVTSTTSSGIRTMKKKPRLSSAVLRAIAKTKRRSKPKPKPKPNPKPKPKPKPKVLRNVASEILTTKDTVRPRKVQSVITPQSTNSEHFQKLFNQYYQNRNP